MALKFNLSRPQVMQLPMFAMPGLTPRELVRTAGQGAGGHQGAMPGFGFQVGKTETICEWCAGPSSLEVLSPLIL